MPKNEKWSMYPSQHDKVSSLLEEEDLDYTFHDSDDDRTCVQSYDTKIKGRYICHNGKCASNGWSSKRVPITIRLYKDQEYNARVYSQRCAGCNRLSRPILDETYADRVAYRIKKWAGVKVEIPPYSGSKRGQGPHQESLCEGCKAGHCSQINR